VAGAGQRALLAVLLLHANEVVSNERLIELLWGGEPPETATTALHGYVSGLRRLLEPDTAAAARAGARAMASAAPWAEEAARLAAIYASTARNGSRAA
jgi:DNA-binding SARP family transcriptional activator